MINQAVRGLLLAMIFTIYGQIGQAAPYAAYVIDARTGKVLHSENADTKLHPASLTKMMTLYLVFTEIRAGRLNLDQKVTVSKKAASQPPSKLGLRSGQKIELRYLVRASAVKSANDAALVLAEAVSGSEAAFAKRMTETARAMGMKNTTFRNPHGLTQTGHMSTAHDMALLGRRLFYDFPEYYNLFSRRSTDAKVKTVYNTNRRLLDAYSGADGIKTGYTRAAGYNLVSSAKRGQERVIVSVFGGKSSAWRNQRVADLLDLGFRKAPSRAQVSKPSRLVLSAPSARQQTVQVARASRVIARSNRPQPRNFSVVTPADAILVATAVNEALTAARASEAPVPEEAMLPEVRDQIAVRTAIAPAEFVSLRPRIRPSDLPVPKTVQVARAQTVVTDAKPSRKAGSWAVRIGGTHNRNEAERLLLTTALQEMEALEGSSREITPTSTRGMYRAQFVGLQKTEAQKACARLAARQTACEVVAQGG